MREQRQRQNVIPLTLNRAETEFISKHQGSKSVQRTIKDLLQKLMATEANNDQNVEESHYEQRGKTN
ncbi:hypothetical protein ACMAZD_09920 [Vibrio sp. nBUS_14]|uniref:hypothetical protein n=1 Tax=Vibrio sp. nBUS_14 TaxID=3395321 RepID=UPI003EB980EB